MFSFVILCIGFLQKRALNSSKIFFGGIKSNIIGKVFNDGANDNTFGWPD